MHAFFLQMIEAFSKAAYGLLRSDKVWYLASLLALASCLTFGVYDIRRQNTKATSAKEMSSLNPTTLGIAKEDRGSSYTPGAQAHWDFFGVPEEAPVTLDVETLPETEMDLELIGTFTSNAEFSSAVIKLGRDETKRVFLQQSITDGVKLHTVNGKEVVIDRGSILETLKLYDFTANEYRVNSPRPSSNAMAATSLPFTPPRSVPIDGYQNTVEEQRRVRQERLEKYIAGNREL